MRNKYKYFLRKIYFPSYSQALIDFNLGFRVSGATQHPELRAPGQSVNIEKTKRSDFYATRARLFSISIILTNQLNINKWPPTHFLPVAFCPRVKKWPPIGYPTQIDSDCPETCPKTLIALEFRIKPINKQHKQQLQNIAILNFSC